MSTTPWPSRTDMPPLAFPLNAPRSENTNDKLSETESRTRVVRHLTGPINIIPAGSFQLISFGADLKFDLMVHE